MCVRACVYLPWLFWGTHHGRFVQRTLAQGPGLAGKKKDGRVPLTLEWQEPDVSSIIIEERMDDDEGGF